MSIEASLRAALVAVGAAILCASPWAGGAAHAAGPPPLDPAVFPGRTLSAVTYVGRTPDARGPGELARFMFQAYLGGDGVALVRVWDAARDSYTPPVERRWSLDGRRLCVGLPRPGPARVCADVHVWGPRIAGVGTEPYVMLDGDLQPGNAVAAGR